MTPVMTLRCILIALGSGALLLAHAGCVAERESRRPPPAPADLRAQTITIAAQMMLDDDNNGYPDTIPVIVYFWDRPERYPLPLWDEGTLRFMLRDEHDRLIAEWEVPPEIVVASRRRDQVGAVHYLTLDIREATTDALPASKAMLSAEFLGDRAHTAHTARPLVVKIGA
jgi:hypothetical protein